MKIKPCPFCGGDAVVFEIKGKDFPFRVQCTNSWCACRTDNYNDYARAIEGWNARVEQDGEQE